MAHDEFPSPGALDPTQSDDARDPTQSDDNEMPQPLQQQQKRARKPASAQPKAKAKTPKAKAKTAAKSRAKTTPTKTCAKAKAKAKAKSKACAKPKAAPKATPKASVRKTCAKARAAPRCVGDWVKRKLHCATALQTAGGCVFLVRALYTYQGLSICILRYTVLHGACQRMRSYQPLSVQLLVLQPDVSSLSLSYNLKKSLHVHSAVIQHVEMQCS